MKKKIWDLYAPIYEKAMRADYKYYKFMYDRIPTKIQNKEVLELATGPGLLAKHVAYAAKRMVATDYSEGMIREAQKGKCVDNLIFEVLKDYPVQIFNWHAWETLPDVNEAYVMTGKCLMGGINRKDITERKKEKIQNQIFQCYKEMGGKHQILTPGCVIRYPLDTDMLMYIKNTLREIEEKLKR